MFKHWESLGEGVDFPFLDNTEPKDVGKRRIFFLPFQSAMFSVAEASLQRKLFLSEPYLPRGQPIRPLQSPLVLCLTKEKGEKAKIYLEGLQSGLLRHTPSHHTKETITRLSKASHHRNLTVASAWLPYKNRESQLGKL